ncbi:right-handed parallel beta-helix repeat-containing protein [Candidatus Poribacteria bacterium]
MDEVKAGKWYFRQLFANGERQTRARFPAEGYYLAEEGVDGTAFKYQEGHFKKWSNLEDVETVIFHSWNEARMLISELDEENRVVRFVDPSARHVLGWGGGGGANRYFIENVFEALQNPGDWYLDRNSGELYYWPVDDVENLEIIAPVLNQLVRMEGGLKERNIQYINFRDLTFADTDWTLPEKGYPDCGDVGDIVDPSAITFENVRHCIFEDNCIRNVGTYALEITGYGNMINGNTIYDTGGGAIISRNYDEECNVMCYNHIHHCGQVYPSAVGINIDDGGGVIRHNLIHNIAHSGIYTRHWATADQTIERENQEQGLIIEYNEIYDVMEKINDGGGLFVRDSNIIIRNNLIHDAFSYSSRCPGWGIYLGCETRDTVVENNVVYRAREGVHVWYSDRNIIMQNNVFLDGEISQINYQNPNDRRHDNIRCLRNIIGYAKADWKLYRISGERSLPAESDYNVYFCPEGDITKADVITGLPGVSTFEEWQEYGLDKNSVVADPMFVDPENDDYSLKPDSPALKLGFKPIDLSTVGLRGREKG